MGAGLPRTVIGPYGSGAAKPASVAASASPERLHRSTGRGFLIALTCLVCLLWQSLVLQTHIHSPHRLAGQATVLSDRMRASEADSSDHADACILCRQLAGSPDLLGPPAQPLAPVAGSVLLPLVVGGDVWLSRFISPGWRGRAPPADL